MDKFNIKHLKLQDKKYQLYNYHHNPFQELFVYRLHASAIPLR